MTDRVLAILSLVALTAFCLVVIVFVREIDLAVTMVLCLLMGAAFCWRDLRSGGGDGG